MAKKTMGKIKLQIEANKANPSPPVGPALGQHGVNIMDFCKQFNADTSDKGGQLIPVEITVYEDRSFSYVLKTPPASFLIKKALNLKSASGRPNTEKVGKLTDAQVAEIAQAKMADLNAHTIDSAKEMIRGTARSMGIECEA